MLKNQTRPSKPYVMWFFSISAIGIKRHPISHVLHSKTLLNPDKAFEQNPGCFSQAMQALSTMQAV
jgi:hypothetical protein